MTRRERFLTPVVLQALVLAAVSRAVLLFINWYSIKAMPYEWPGFHTWAQATTMVGGWMQWDAGHYYRIVANGYAISDSSSHGVPAFFPLYPAIIDVMLKVLGSSPVWMHVGVAGMIVSHACFLLAVPLLAWLVEGMRGEQVARLTSLLVVTSPFSLFYSSIYTESLFLLLVVGTFALALNGYWIPAAILVAAATATRVTGVALIPALLLMGWRRGLPLPLLGIIGTIAPLGLIAFMVYTGVRLGEPLAFLNAQEEWGGFYERAGQYLERFVTDPESIVLGDPTNITVVLNLLLLGASIATVPWMWRHLDPGIALFSTLVMLQALTSWVSLGRYLLPAIGVYIAYATFLSRPDRSVLRQGVFMASTLLLGVFTFLFAHGRWVN